MDKHTSKQAKPEDMQISLLTSHVGLAKAHPDNSLVRIKCITLLYKGLHISV